MIRALFLKHPIAATITIWYLFSAFVSGMPDPIAASGFAYRWLFKSLHLLAGNILRSGVLRRVGVQSNEQDGNSEVGTRKSDNEQGTNS